MRSLCANLRPPRASGRSASICVSLLLKRRGRDAGQRPNQFAAGVFLTTVTLIDDGYCFE